MDIFADSTGFLLYVGVMLSPFIQEDAAVATAALLSATGKAKTGPLFIMMFIGLFLSDTWKYWIGWAALRNEKARKFTEKKHVAELKDKVQTYTITTLFAARFIPLTRIPTYVACGYFKVNYAKFCICIAATALLYISIVFCLFHTLGVVMGEKIIWAMPLAAIIIVACVIGYRFWRSKTQNP